MVAEGALLGLTTTFVFVFDLENNTVTNHFVDVKEDSILEREREMLHCIERSPDVDPLRFSSAVDRLKIHIHACHHAIYQPANSV